MTVHATYLSQTGYYPEDLLQQMNDWIAPGVMNMQDLQVSAQSTPAMSVQVSGASQGTVGGNAWLPGGYRFYNDSPLNVIIATADPTNPRIDLIVAGIDTTQTPYQPTIKAISGTPAATPVAPTVPTGYIGLAQISVAANATTVTAANITDFRSLASLQGNAVNLLGVILSSQKGVANGVATTDANNKVVQTANQADKLSTARTISLSGYATGSASFDGSSDESIDVTLADSGVAAGTYEKVTVDAKGRVTEGSALALSDVTGALGFTPATTGANTFTGTQTAPALSASGLTGATAGARSAGGTTSGAPTSGTFEVGDFVVDQTGNIFICTIAGTPGTWISVYKSASGTWTPASGSLNVSAGTTINIASIPIGANTHFASVNNPATYSYNAASIGITTGTSTSGLQYSNGGGAFGYKASGTSVVSGAPVSGNWFPVYDGTYYANGYFQISGNNLQYVVLQSGTSTGTADSVTWKVW